MPAAPAGSGRPLSWGIQSGSPGISRLSCGVGVASCAGLAYGERHTEVVMTKKIVSCLFALVLLLGSVFPAAALEIHIDNS